MMKSSDAIKCMLGACLASAYLAPEALGLISLLCLLPYARAESNSNTWVSLQQGEVGEYYSLNSLSITPDGSIISSGIHNGDFPNYDGIITILNQEGELTYN